MRKRSKEEKRRIVEESGLTVARVAQAHGLRAGQGFEWRRAYKEGRLAAEPNGAALLPVRLSNVARPARPASTAGVIYVELSDARVEIHGGDPYIDWHSDTE